MFKRHNYALGLAWLGILFLVPLPFVQTVDAGLPAIYNDERQAVLFGVIAYVWMLTAIYLSTRPRWLDRLIGLPEMYLIHGLLSIAALGLAYLHKTSTQSQGWIERTGDWAFNLFLAVMLYSLIFLAGWLTSRVPPLAQLKTWLEKIFKHEFNVWVHRLNLVATLLIFIHVLLIPYIRAITPFLALFLAASLGVAASYAWAKLGPRAAGRLLANRPLTPGVQELTIRLPRTQQPALHAGDFIFLSFPTLPGLREPHPFSIVNDPANDRTVIRLAIRGDGDFTRQLASVAPPQPVVLQGLRPVPGFSPRTAAGPRGHDCWRDRGRAASVGHGRAAAAADDFLLFGPNGSGTALPGVIPGLAKTTGIHRVPASRSFL